MDSLTNTGVAVVAVAAAPTATDVAAAVSNPVCGDGGGPVVAVAAATITLGDATGAVKGLETSRGVVTGDEEAFPSSDFRVTLGCCSNVVAGTGHSVSFPAGA